MYWMITDETAIWCMIYTAALRRLLAYYIY